MALKSKSRNVNGYVAAELRRRALAAKLEAKERALDPLRVKLRNADTQVKIRLQKLSGGQLGEARRILDADPAIAAALEHFDNRHED